MKKKKFFFWADKILTRVYKALNLEMNMKLKMVIILTTTIRMHIHREILSRMWIFKNLNF